MLTEQEPCALPDGTPVSGLIDYRRHVSNVRAYRTRGYVLVIRSHADTSAQSFLSAARDDLVRRTPLGWRLARPDIYLGQSTLGVPNLAFFL